MGRTIDPNIHLGERYGRLVIKEYDHKDQFGRHIYKCQCDCGNTAIVAYTSMCTGHTTSCGCYNREQSSADHDSRIGQKFNMLTILSFDHKSGKHIYYRCRCDCGNEKVIRYDSLKDGSIKSCGCLQSNRVSQKDLSHIGETWGRMTIIAFDHTDRTYNKWYRTRCQCGNEKVVTYGSLKHGQVVSCGCYSREIHTKHGMSHDRLYTIWRGMRDRCNRSEDPRYPRYGGRGIKVCDLWNSAETGFDAFYSWSMSHGYAEDLSIDRIDNDGNYDPTNCRWTTSLVQMNNTRSNVYIAYLLKKDSDPPYLVYTYAEWAKILNIDYFVFRNRIINHGVDTINEVIEDCYREGHNIPYNEELIMHVDNDIIAMNHIFNFTDSIHD